MACIVPDREWTSQPMFDVLSNQTDEKNIKQHSFQLTVLSHVLTDKNPIFIPIFKDLVLLSQSHPSSLNSIALCFYWNLYITLPFRLTLHYTVKSSLLQFNHHVTLELGETLKTTEFNAIHLEMKRKRDLGDISCLVKAIQIKTMSDGIRGRTVSIPRPPKYLSVESQLECWAASEVAESVKRLIKHKIPKDLVFKSLLWKGKEMKKRAYSNEGSVSPKFPVCASH